MYGCESWTIKKAEHWRIDAFELWCWRRLLRVPWTARGSNQSILRISVLNILWKDWCRSWSSNTLATWCEELIHLKRPWCWERLKAGRKGNDRGWDDCMVSQPWWTWVWPSSGQWGKTGKLGVLQSMESERFRHDWATERKIIIFKKIKIKMNRYSISKLSQHSVKFSSVTQSCPTLCNPMNHSMPGLPVHH